MDAIGKTGKTIASPAKAGACLGYIQGAVDGLQLAMATGVVSKSFKACVPEASTTDELVRVFLKFIDDHPEGLSYAAADVVWSAMTASYPCCAN
jgi:hypothetical protein